MTAKIIGLKKASDSTANWPKNCGFRTAIYYDKDTGDIWATDLANCKWIQHKDPQVIHVCDTVRHMSQKALARAVEKALQENK